MSALGQKQTFTHLRPMSALPPKADIVGSGRERSCGANKADSSDPPFGYVTDLIACHCRKIVTEEDPPCDWRRTGLCHLGGHPFEETLALFSRILDVPQFESSTNQQRLHFIRRCQMADR